MSTGNFFNDLVNQIKSKTESEILSIATDSMREFIPASQMTDAKRIFQVLLLAATIGVEGKKQLNAKEKRLIDDFFGDLCSDISIVYEFIAQPITEKEWGVLEMFPNMGGVAVGLPLLKLILCFAFVDGKLSNDIAEKLENIFGIVLLGNFFNN